jgi:copper chaperone
MKMEKTTLKIEGMSCGHCVKAVEEALKEVDGVKKVSVSLENKSAEIEFDASKADIAALKAAVEEQGYDVL